MPKTKRTRSLCVAAVCVASFATVLGCSGNLQCSFVSTNMTRISVEPTDARVVQLRCPECYWWVDDSGKLSVSGRFEQQSLWNSMQDRRFLVSFVLGEPSQGVGKDYSVNRDTVSGYIKTPWNAYRFNSVYGIVGVEHRAEDRIVGAYRMHVALQPAKFLGGWGQPSPFLLYGTFDAKRNNRAGSAIRTITEENAFERKPSTRPSQTHLRQMTTQPVVRQRPIPSTQSRP